MDLAALAMFAPVKKVVDIYRYLVTGDKVQWKEALTVVGSWVAGAGMVALVAASNYATEFGLTGLNLADVVLAGITIGSLAGVVSDLANPEGVRIE